MPGREHKYNTGSVFITINSNGWINSLPKELLLSILAYLPPADLYALSRTCKQLHNLCHDLLFKNGEPAFRHWRIGFFQRQQVRINGDIAELYAGRSNECSTAASLSLGGISIAMSSYFTYKKTASTPFVSRDEKIALGVFLVLSLLLLLTGFAKVVRNYSLGRSIQQSTAKIDLLSEKIDYESRQLLKK